MTMNDIEQRYRNAVGQALAGFQLIEEGLKVYLSAYHTLVRALLPDEIAYGYTGDDLRDAPLGTLLRAFARANANETLIRELRAEQGLRDELAHRAYLDLFGEKVSEPEVETRIDPMIRTCGRVASLVGRVYFETQKLFKVAGAPLLPAISAQVGARGS